MSLGVNEKEVLPFTARSPMLDIAKETDLISPDLDAGFQTIPGWWAIYESEALRLLSNPLMTFHADADKLEDLCVRDKIDYRWVTAPRAYRRIGLVQARAFPTSLLEEFYPQYP